MPRQQAAGGRGGSGQWGGYTYEEAGADARSLASATLIGRDVTYEEGSAPKENDLASVATPVETITEGVIDANLPKEKLAAGSSSSSSINSGTGSVSGGKGWVRRRRTHRPLQLLIFPLANWRQY